LERRKRKRKEEERRNEEKSGEERWVRIIVSEARDRADEKTMKELKYDDMVIRRSWVLAREKRALLLK
jgi:uncharacterized protein YaiI (UPF0178 family)